MGIERENLGLRRVDLGPANVIGLVNDLSLKIGKVHDISVDQADCPDASRRQIQSDRGAQPAGADYQDLCLADLMLSLAADFGQEDMPAVAGDLFF